MKYYIYQIINSMNNKIYVGVHKTANLNDGYMGSGKVIQRAMVKHGPDNFLKVILQFFDTEADMYAREKELVNEEFLLREDVYNLRRGGHGGWDYLNTGEGLKERVKSPNFKNWHNAGRLRVNELREEDEEYNSKYLAKRKLCMAKATKQSMLNHPNGTFKDKKHSESTKEQMRASAVGKHDGELNSQYGTKWIYNLDLKISKKINKDDILPDGWKLGRKLKF